MITIKGMEEIPSCCRHCPCSDDSQCNLTTQYNDLKGRPDDCPLVEIVTCKDCKHWHDDGIMTTCDKNIGHGFPKDHFCSDGKRKECRDTEERFVNGLPRSEKYFEERITGNPDFCNG